MSRFFGWERPALMKRTAAALLPLAVALPAASQPYQPTSQEKQAIRAGIAELDRLIQSQKTHSLIEDVEVYHKAAEWILRHEEEFYTPAYAANTLAVLERGLARARELQAGKPGWVAQKGRLTRAYRSRVDGSVQPYGLVIPDSYDAGRPVRLDVVLHGRGATLNEVSFITAHDSAQPVPPGQDFIQLDVFGRTNNAYRWAGETDVFEALESVRQRYNIDPRRIVLRGFSMGGAGAWHIGLHYPDQWAAVEAGAGFTETRRYAKLEHLQPYQEAALRIYDAVDYALNAFNVPIVGYGGEEDPQLQASVNIREQLAREGLELADLRALFLIGPKTGHRFHAESKKQSDAFIDQMIAGGRRSPDRVRFVTYTARYNHCFGLTVDALEKHYDRAEVDAQRSNDGLQVLVRTKNIARLTLSEPGLAATIDGQRFDYGQRPVSFEKRSGQWAISLRNDPALRKKHGLQGPIDDAFTDSFLCVRPTGASHHPQVKDYAVKALDRFAKEYAKWLRADVQIKDDRAVTGDDIAGHHLILFGDPTSNSVIARIARRLPIRWTSQTITTDGQKFSAADHVPVLIYPNPLNPRRYVVLNSGHTFGEQEFRGTNALLFPRLGDYAVLRLTGEVALAGLFDDQWQWGRSTSTAAGR